LRSHLRLAPTPQFDVKLDLTGIGLPDLISAAQSIFFQARQQSALSTVVARPRITIREKIRRIAQLLRDGQLANFTSLVHDRSSRLDIVVTFLAVLELIKTPAGRSTPGNCFW
jgi:chromatin segregation and condensation protein Rec8/ScpA/Scc1 (kleisin family)